MRVLLLVIAFVFFSGCAPAPKEVHLQGRTMGTTYNVKFTPDNSIAYAELQQQFEQRLAEINRLMSTYDPQSELSLFNAWHSMEPFAVSQETAKVLNEAIRLGRLTGGVLDVTVGPLVNLWGFGPEAQPEQVPSEEAITQTKNRIGLNKLAVATTSAQKSQADLYVDLSTIAKGYAVDQLAEILLAKNINHFLVEIGGEMRVAGNKANGHEWRIAIEKPVTHERAIQRLISIGDNAIATSGDYRNYYELDGIRYSHLIDPRTGYPIQHNLVSVTVVHPSSMTADGLSTALIVMGLENAMQLVQQENIAALFVTKEGDDFIEYTSPAFGQTVKTIKN